MLFRSIRPCHGHQCLQRMINVAALTIILVATVQAEVWAKKGKTALPDDCEFVYSKTVQASIEYYHGSSGTATDHSHTLKAIEVSDDFLLKNCMASRTAGLNKQVDETLCAKGFAELTRLGYADRHNTKKWQQAVCAKTNLNEDNTFSLYRILFKGQACKSQVLELSPEKFVCKNHQRQDYIPGAATRPKPSDDRKAVKLSAAPPGNYGPYSDAFWRVTCEWERETGEAFYVNVFTGNKDGCGMAMGKHGNIPAGRDKRGVFTYQARPGKECIGKTVSLVCEVGTPNDPDPNRANNSVQTSFAVFQKIPAPEKTAAPTISTITSSTTIYNDGKSNTIQIRGSGFTQDMQVFTWGSGQAVKVDRSIFKNSTTFLAVITVPTSTKPGKYTIQVGKPLSPGTAKYSITVNPKPEKIPLGQ